MHVEAVRSFNRFYTRRIGVLRPGIVGSPYALPEARVLYALGRDGGGTATALGRELSLDLGYLSRLLQSLRRRGLIQAKRAAHDWRQRDLTLTEKGRKAYEMLDSRSREEMEQMLSPLAQHDRDRLVASMSAIQALLEKGTEKEGEPPIVLREHRPGDMGWVVERHAALYHEQDGWGAAFEALCAGIVKDFLEKFDPARERCWIAERGGERLGCVFVVNDKNRIARLRLLLVEPSARGAGLGRRLVAECIQFAREKGYRKLVLWTHAHLSAARAIYRKAGFRKLPKTDAHDTFGARAVSEFWELNL